jgi:hypothetical protein
LITSQQILDKYPDKDSYEWKNHGVHIYNVLKKKEESLSFKKTEKLKKEVVGDHKLLESIVSQAMKENPTGYLKDLKSNKEYKALKKKLKKK